MNSGAINSLLRWVASYGLPGAPAAPIPQLLDRPAFQSLLRAAQWERVVPLLAQVVVDGELPTTEDQLVEVLDAELRSMSAVLGLEANLVEVAEQLADANVPFRVLKGPAVAHLDYGDPALRDFGDIDLLIAADAFDRAVNLLGTAGYHRRFPEPRDGFDRRFAKSVSVVGPAGQDLDLHRTLASGGFGHRIIVSMLWSAQPDRFTVGGRALETLGTEERFLHACYHMVLGNKPPRLVPQRDIAQMLLTGELATDRVLALAAAWRGEAVVANAIAITWGNLELAEHVPLSIWATNFKPRRSEARELARAMSPHYSYAAQAFDSIRAFRSVGDQLAYVSAMAFPRRTYLQGRHTGFTSRIRYAFSEVVNTRISTKEHR